MVSLLETLYVLVVAAFVGAIVLHVKGKRLVARRVGYLGAIGALLALVMYWYLGRSG